MPVVGSSTLSVSIARTDVSCKSDEQACHTRVNDTQSEVTQQPGQATCVPAQLLDRLQSHRRLSRRRHQPIQRDRSVAPVAAHHHTTGFGDGYARREHRRHSGSLHMRASGWRPNALFAWPCGALPAVARQQHPQQPPQPRMRQEAVPASPRLHGEPRQRQARCPTLRCPLLDLHDLDVATTPTRLHAGLTASPRCAPGCTACSTRPPPGGGAIRLLPEQRGLHLEIRRGELRAAVGENEDCAYTGHGADEGACTCTAQPPAPGRWRPWLSTCRRRAGLPESAG